MLKIIDKEGKEIILEKWRNHDKSLNLAEVVFVHDLVIRRLTSAFFNMENVSQKGKLP